MSVTIDIGAVRNQDNIFYAKGMDWLFYVSGSNIVYKTSIDGGLTWSQAQIIPLSSWVSTNFSLWYDKPSDRFHMVFASGAGGSANPVYYLNGIPNLDGSVSLSQGQIAQPGGQYADINNARVVCDSNGFPWITFSAVNLMGTTFAYVMKSSTKEIWTTHWVKSSAIYYPGNATNPHFRRGVLIPTNGGGMYLAYEIYRTDSYQRTIDPNGQPVLMSRFIDANGNFSDPPVMILEDVHQTPETGLRVGSDYHIVWLDQTTMSILHAVNTTIKEVMPGFPSMNNRVALTYDKQRNRLLCFWADFPLGAQLYYRAYDLATGLWEPDVIDWLDESATGINLNTPICINPLNDFIQERFPVAWQSSSYVRFAATNFRPPIVRTLPATDIML